MSAQAAIMPALWCAVKSSPALLALPLPVERALVQLGHDICIARRRRNLTSALVAARAFVSRNTITRVERGDAGVSLGIYASVLFVLGLTDRLAHLADPACDSLGMDLAAEQLPRRIRSGRSTQAVAHEP